MLNDHFCRGWSYQRNFSVTIMHLHGYCYSVLTVDTPDPYIHMSIKTAPEGRRQTTVKDNEVNPVWNETFTFLLDEAVENVMGKTHMYTCIYIRAD